MKMDEELAIIRVEMRKAHTDAERDREEMRGVASSVGDMSKALGTLLARVGDTTGGTARGGTASTAPALQSSRDRHHQETRSATAKDKEKNPMVSYSEEGSDDEESDEGGSYSEEEDKVDMAMSWDLKNSEKEQVTASEKVFLRFMMKKRPEEMLNIVMKRYAFVIAVSEIDLNDAKEVLYQDELDKMIDKKIEAVSKCVYRRRMLSKRIHESSSTPY